ncbi:ABC transporter ATP-binding protein [Streptomyces sp. Lzd4kr]|nr:ABC transporter ATP-binding protein [Streptomyces sp. Lzd4kr]
MGSTITLRDLSKTYCSGKRAVRDVSLHLESGEFLVLLGPSGCGKSTLLRMIAGLEDITSGELLLNQRSANDLPASERDIAMVFQNFALYPSKTAADNIGFPLLVRGYDKPEVAEAVCGVADRLGIQSLLDRTPAGLSGGERQRVAMGRAVIRRPSIFLMDEPLASLDARRRVSLRTEILAVVRRTGATTVYVTHDQAEAMAMGDRIAVLRDGALQQIGTPDELYDLPANAFVANFVGTPRINLVHGTLFAAVDGAVTISLGQQRLALPPSLAQAYQLLRVLQGRPLLIGLRLEALRISAGMPTPYERSLIAIVTHAEFQGHEVLLHATVGARHADVPRTVSESEEAQHSSNVLVQWLRSTIRRVRGALPHRSQSSHRPAPPLPDHYRLGELVFRVQHGSRCRPGTRLSLLVDMRALMLFDSRGDRVFPHLTHEPDL